MLFNESGVPRKSWIFSGYSGFLSQGKLTGWDVEHDMQMAVLTPNSMQSGQPNTNTEEETAEIENVYLRKRAKHMRFQVVPFEEDTS